jgi:hypothetical protein
MQVYKSPKDLITPCCRTKNKLKRKISYYGFNHRFWFAVIILMQSFAALGQLSPGKLAKPHTHLEGLSNCTKCHELGEKVSEKKCLDCHKELRARISQNKGYHVSKEIKGKSCISCHSDHHGVNFEMIRFDKKAFNHKLTGYELKDKHKIEDCAKCHRDENIKDPAIKKLKKTFLGLDQKCLSCHEDYHQKTLSNDCVQCHDYKGFKPAPLFKHNKTEFPLNGAHEKVKCESCHKKEVRGGQEFQKFSGIPFKNCNACHQDPHKGEFGQNCKTCHNEVSFQQIKSNSGFNHSLTGFDLQGKHKAIDCRACHDNRPGTKGTYKEFENVQKISCVLCHKDEHENIFGNTCDECHDQFSFKIRNGFTGFNHSLTGFVLENKHQAVDCKKCHTGAKMTDPLLHNRCADCHKDYHQGDFLNTPYTDCASCHSTTGFNESSFDFEKHEKSTFPLSGAHMATPCIACHKKTNTWKFRDIGTKCADCHTNIHDGYMDVKYIPDNDCRKCHDDQTWKQISFEHDQTGFRLEGKHKAASCRNCHFEYNNGQLVTQKFEFKDTSCVSCHQNVHDIQFEVDGKTDCNRCHGFEKWDRSNFNHNNAAFKLEGAHEQLSCEKCHLKEQRNGKELVIYKTGKLECADCHK